MKYVILISLILPLLLIAQTNPVKWKWTVHWRETHGSTGMGMESMKSHTIPHAPTFTDRKKAYNLFWHLVVHRDRPDRLDIGGEPEIIRNVRIDSVQIK